MATWHRLRVTNITACDNGRCSFSILVGLMGILPLGACLAWSEQGCAVSSPPKPTLAEKESIINMGAYRGGLPPLICQVKLTRLWIYSHRTFIPTICWVVATTLWVRGALFRLSDKKQTFNIPSLGRVRLSDKKTNI